MRKIIMENWLIISAGLILTAVSVRAAYLDRGYIAVGGEWLILPIMLLTKRIVKEIRKEIVGWIQ